MRGLKFAICAAALAALAAPAWSQNKGLGQQFIDAVRQQDAGTAQQLINGQAGIVDSRDDKGDTALIIAIDRGDENWTGFLLGNGADPNLPERGHGDPPIVAAARVGFDQAAEWLLEMDAKVDSANRMGETALIVAVQRRDLHLVKFLLRHGANPDKSDSAAGYSARDYAKRDPRSRDILQAIGAAKTAN